MEELNQRNNGKKYSITKCPECNNRAIKDGLSKTHRKNAKYYCEECDIFFNFLGVLLDEKHMDTYEFILKNNNCGFLDWEIA